ncbi:uncharacterized protein LOC142497430 isoform X3 [Ascaphus truei]|uniref:uncharacterized protein LOC142497430 isoform X3 n=1 Tax=Ascaphus truei TaxID=8439 RepID=UPI003F592AEB
MAHPPEKKKSRPRSLAGISQISNDISKKFLDRSDLARLLQIFSGSFKDQSLVLAELDTFFISDPQAKIKLVFVEDSIIVKNIFIMSSAMQELAQKFPENLYVDLLKNVSPGFNLYSVSCEDDNSGWKVCANCISKTNSSDTLRFLIVSVLQSMPKMKAQIKCVTIHPAITDPLDMGTLLPNITMRHCILLIVQILEHKIFHLDFAVQAQIKTILHILLHTRSLKVYNRHLNDLRAICPAEIFQYYFETWHPSRKLWCTKDNKRLKAEKSIYTYVTSLHYTLAAEMGTSLSLNDCLRVVLNDTRELTNVPEVVPVLDSLPVPDIPSTDSQQVRFNYGHRLGATDDRSEGSPGTTEGMFALRVPLFALQGSGGRLESPTAELEEGLGSHLTPRASDGHLVICEESKKNGLECTEFHSWEEFQSFLDTWCEEQKTIFVIRHSVPLTDEDMSYDLIQSLKYSSVNLGCSSFTRKRCPATIQLKLGPEKDKLIITKADLDHSHDSEIDLPSRYTRKPISYVEVPPILSNEVSDKFMDRNDLTKLLRLNCPFGGESQLLDELESIFNSDPAAKVKLVYTEDKFIVKNIFVMTSVMQSLLKHFPEHIYVDFFPGLNQEFDLYSVICQDESFSWKVCAHCIARKDSPESAQFLMRSVLQSHPNLSHQVKYFTLSPEVRNHLDTEELLPSASVRYCLPLVLDIMHRKISFLSQMEQSQIKNLLVSLAQTSSTDVYTQHLGDLKSACPDEVFQYYFDTWHPCWKLWSGRNTRTKDIENTIYTYVKSKHEEMKVQVGSLPSLHLCLQAILSEDQAHVELSESNYVNELERSTSSATLEFNATESKSFLGEQEPVPEDKITTCVIQKDCEEMEKETLNGKEFLSWGDFCSHLEAWSEEQFLVRQASSLTEQGDGEKIAIPEVSQPLKYSWAQLFCNRKDCSAFIELTLDPQKDKLVITQSSLNHTHDIDETILPPPAKKCKMSSAVGLPAQVANNISRKFLEPSDIKRLLRFRSGAFQDRTQVLAELDSLFISDPDAKVKLVFVEDKLLVKKIFLMTSVMKDIAYKLPDHLFIDVFSEFSQSFDLYTIFCEEKGAGWKVCAYCIAKKGVEDILDFLTSSVVQIIPTLNSQMKHLTVNAEIQEPLNLETHLPHVSIRYCMHLVLDVLYRKISHLDTTVAAQIKNYLHILSQTCSLKVYNRYLNDLKAICPDEIFQYYYDTWHPRRKMWVKKDNKIEDAERTIFEIVSLRHEKLAAELGPLPSLHQCLCAVLGDDHKTSADKSHLQDAHTTPFSQHQGSPAISPSSNEQTEDGELPILEEEAELSLHKEVFSEKNIDEVITESSVEGLERNEFNSWDDFCSFLDNWCEARKVMFAIRHSVVLHKEEIQNFPLGPEVAKSLRYSTVSLGCRSCPRKSCPALIKLGLGPQMDRLIVTKSNLRHNHYLPKSSFTFHVRKRNRQTTPVDLQTRITNDISRKFLEQSDLKRLLPFSPGSFEDRNKVFAELDSLFISDPSVKVKLVFIEEESLVKYIFVMTSHMRDLAQRFPGHLFVDRLPSFSPNFDLYTVFCEEDGMGWKTCAYCIAQEDISDTLRFIIVSVVQSIPKMNMQVKLITFSPEIKDPLDLESVVPNASMKYCEPMVMDVLYRKAAHLDFSAQAQIKNCLRMLAQTNSPKLYSQYLFDLTAASPPEVFQYYYEIWHPRRKLWVNGSSKGSLTDSHIFSHVKSKHKELMIKRSTPSSLYECLHVVLNDNQSLPIIRESCSVQESHLTPISSSQIVELPPSVSNTENSSLRPPSTICTTVKQERTYLSSDPYGMKFYSWNEFCEFFDHLCKEKKTIYKINNITCFEKTDPKAEVYKYQLVQLVCHALDDVPADERCTQSNTMPTLCPASITLQFSMEKNCLVVTQAQLEHNHRTSHQRFAALFKYSSLTSYNHLSSLVSGIAGKFITLQDLKMLLAWKQFFQTTVLDLLKLLRALISADPVAKVKLAIFPETLQLESVFIMTSQMRCFLDSFPPAMFLGKPLAVNENYDLYTAMCEDNEKKTKECAYFITQKGSPAPFSCIVVSLIQSIPDVKACLKDMLLQIDMKELNLVRDLLPSCCVRMSQTHALNALYQHVKQGDPTTQEKLKGLMYSLVNCCSPDLYNNYFTELEASSPDNFLQYFLQTWHSCKKDWCHGMKEGHFLECAARQEEELRSLESFPSSPASCIQALIKLMVPHEDDDEPMDISDAYNEQTTELPTSPRDTTKSSSTSPICWSDTTIKEESVGKSSDLKGMLFQSWTEFCEFFDHWCEENKTLYKIAKATHLKNVKEETHLRHFSYELVVLVCKATEDWPQQRRTLGPVPSSCPASITLQFSAENNCLVISQAQLQHNHILDPQKFRAYFRYCSLTSRPRFAALTSSISIRFATLHHLRKLLNWSKVLEPDLLDVLKELEVLLSEDPMAKLKLEFCPETLSLKSVFIMTSQTRHLLENFPSMLFLGQSLTLNDNFELYTVLCEDDESKGREGAYFITRKESITPILYMVVSLIQSIPEIKEHIEGMVLQVDLKELDLIQDLLPSCCVRMSQTHALDTICCQLKEEDPATQETLKSLIYNLVHCRTPSLYNSYFKELVIASPEHFFQYFLNTWHIRKEDWVESWGHRMKDGHFLEFSALQANELRSMLSFPSSLASCIKVLLKVMESGEKHASQNNNSPPDNKKQCVVLPLKERDDVMSCSLSEASSLCSTIKNEDEKRDPNNASEDGDMSPVLATTLAAEYIKMESEVQLQNHTIPDSDICSVTIGLPDVIKQEVLDSLTNGTNSIVPQTPENSITSSSVPLDIAVPLLEEGAAFWLPSKYYCSSWSW